MKEAGDELEESDRIPSPRSMSAPHSPDAREEVLQADAEDVLSENEKKLKNNKQMGPKTPPGNEEDDEDKMDDTKVLFLIFGVGCWFREVLSFDGSFLFLLPFNFHKG